jgi:hypothetical protein
MGSAISTTTGSAYCWPPTVDAHTRDEPSRSPRDHPQRRRATYRVRGPSDRRDIARGSSACNRGGPSVRSVPSESNVPSRSQRGRANGGSSSPRHTAERSSGAYDGRKDVQAAQLEHCRTGAAKAHGTARPHIGQARRRPVDHTISRDPPPLYWRRRLEPLGPNCRPWRRLGTESLRALQRRSQRPTRSRRVVRIAQTD